MVRKSSRPTRRRFLTTLATSSVGAAALSDRVGASESPLGNDDDIPGGTNAEPTKAQRRAYLRDQYGRREAAILQATARQYRRKVERGMLSADEAFRRATDDVLAHPRTPRVSAEIEDRRELLTRLETTDTGASTTDEISTAAVGDRTSVSIGRSEAGSNTWGIGAADRAVNVSERRMHANARVAGIGGATSYTRLYGRITPNSSIGGAVRMSLKYFRQGGAVGGDTRIAFFVRETARPSSTVVYFPVESPGFVQGSVTKSAQFTMPAGVQHDVGVQLHTSVDTIAAAYFYADYFTTVLDLSRRRVQLESPIRVEALD